MLNLSDFDIDLNDIQEDPKSAIAHVLNQYERAAKSYRDNGEKATTGIKAVVAKVKESEPATVNLNNDLVTKLRSLIYEVLLNDPSVSVLLFDSIQELKDGIASFRQEAMRSITVESDGDEEDSQDISPEEMYEEVEFLHKALSNFVNFAQMSTITEVEGTNEITRPFTVRDLPSSLREVNKKSNKLEVKLPRKPNGPDTKEGDSTKGRHAAIYKMAYKLNGEDIPSGISLNRLALFYCSTPSEWINGSDLMAEVEKQNDGKSWGAMDSFSVDVPMGKLTAIKIKQS